VDRRHSNVTHIATAISVRDFRDKVGSRCLFSTSGLAKNPSFQESSESYRAFQGSVQGATAPFSQGSS
jgi:hypothetical protein